MLPFFRGPATPARQDDSRSIVPRADAAPPYREQPTGGLHTGGDAWQAVSRQHERESHLQKLAPDGTMRSLVQHEVAQQMAASLGGSSNEAAAAPVQVIIQNKATTSTEQAAPQQVEALPTMTWRGVLRSIWESNGNRLCIVGLLGAVAYIYHGQSQHNWRMAELQRRIDRNPFLRVVQQALGSS
eukprot:TRINITY_DN92357_c0_g1_i1.p1 TRINITY_DN92357_c0_g1~~TRINITY_DN92357_c0_g1_i1.p1  ORF type:complete len:185 (-),score=33.55 TRINITY_DN92357_c0_g1_i1:154-708(-)